MQGNTLAAARLFELLPSHPILTINRVVRILETTRPTAAKAVRSLVEAGRVGESLVRELMRFGRMPSWGTAVRRSAVPNVVAQRCG